MSTAQELIQRLQTEKPDEPLYYVVMRPNGAIVAINLDQPIVGHLYSLVKSIKNLNGD